MDEPQANTDLQDSPRPGLGGSHHLSPYSIFLCLVMGPTPKCHFDPGLPNWNPKIPKIGTPTTL